MNTNDKTSNKASTSFVKHTCPFRDRCWAEIDDRTLGADVRDKAQAAKSRVQYRKPSKKRLQPCGFEGTSLEFCAKYRRWAAEQEEPGPTGSSGQLVLLLAL